MTDYKEKILAWVNANRKRIFHEGFQPEFREFLTSLPSEEEIGKGLWEKYYKERLDRIDLESHEPPEPFPDFPDWLYQRNK